MEIRLLSKLETAELDITPTPRILQVLENLAVEPWRCLAEFIDNSLDDFRKNQKDQGEIKINIEDGKLIFSDNGSGMSVKELESALRAGYSSKSKVDELGLFGIGFNVACANLGRKATVITKQLQDEHWTSVEIDIVDLTKRNTFKIQPQGVSVTGYGDAGTIIVVDLKTDLAANFERQRYIDGIAKQLGRAYSYILRESVPGLTGPEAGNAREVKISIAELQVKPHLPCIWSEERSVTYRNQVVQAVEKFRRDLPDSAVCNDCGHWSERATVTTCANCGSAALTISHRQVWGWIGVQRYMDGIEFGLDFIRNGRTILFKDKDIFTFHNPNTGELMKDYPVEWPADKGRIVGEVHCDHVRVDFIKKAFDVNDPNWLGAITVVRGDSSLQPKRAEVKNNSPLSKIFNAFRINEPGSNYLIPGNGAKAIHDATKNWAIKFHEGDLDYSSDEKWFDAVQSHDRLAKQAKNAGTVGVVSEPTILLNPLIEAQEPPPSQKAPERKETINDLMDRLEAGGTIRTDLSKKYHLSSVGKEYQINIWETISVITHEGKIKDVWSHPVKGSQINVYLYTSSDLFLKYRRSKADIALTEAAQLVKNLSNSNLSVTAIYFDLLKHLPDEEYSEGVLRGRIEELQTRVLTKLVPLVASNPGKYIEALSDFSLEAAESNATSLFPKKAWSQVRDSGNVALCLTLHGLIELIEKLPEELFDGKLFTQHYATAHAQRARDRTQGYTLKALRDLSDIKNSANHLNAYELSLCEISLNFINEILV